MLPPAFISINALQVISPINRQKALLMFINLVRWVRTVHDQHLLPVHKHRLFRDMARPSPYPGECKCFNVTRYVAAAPRAMLALKMSSSTPSAKGCAECKSSCSLSQTAAMVCRTHCLSPCQSSDAETESRQEENCSASSSPGHLGEHVPDACIWSHHRCLSG